MPYTVDLHTHTIASGHAYNTIREMAKAASEKGLTHLGIVEHGPGIPGTCSPMYFRNLKVVPRELYGVKLFLGGELNILDHDGTLCLDESYWMRMDIRIAGMHSTCYETGTKEENMRAILSAIHNPWVDIICHPDDGRYMFDYEPIVLAAKESGTILELNNNALSPRQHRKHSFENYVQMLTYCKQYDVPVLISSDAHFDTEICDFHFAQQVLDATQFPKELLVNEHLEFLWETFRRKKTPRESVDIDREEMTSTVSGAV